MPSPAAKNPLKHLHPADYLGLARLATQATVGVATISEEVHQNVWRTLGVPGGQRAGQARGVTGFVYKSVRGVTEVVATGIDAVLGRLVALLEAVTPDRPSSNEREAVLAALNGVMGDQLVATGNPLATPMTFRHQGHVLCTEHLKTLAPPAINGKILLLIHGLCMNDLQWTQNLDASGAASYDHGQALASSLGYTPIYLRYNSGLHTSQNGRELATQLEELLRNWPMPVQELTILAHSMGGLITRGAVHLATQQGLQWPDRLKSIVFLGTPHHGAPMERAGNWIDVVLGSTRYSAPFAKIGQLRSAGITDLRYGHVLDEDWVGHDRFRRSPDRRQPLALPRNVNCYAVAATTAPKRGTLAERLLGDGLVPIPSALGQHPQPERRLAFDKSEQLIVYRKNHWDLLRAPEVARQLLRWLTPD
ncbi:alpha/beta hydrolase [Rhodoferax sp.]|uniref:PGAP1-like alpha/beta domain-containing protein n=1 Tax=Rhodoferax sp. TaxID=50421 RepID=UPI002774AB6B|nr:alpha/beta hydrolase [Rhodoferax sp.]